MAPPRAHRVTDARLQKHLARTSQQHRFEVADLLARSASVIRRRGWCIGAMEDDSGRVCLMGAIKQAATTLFTPSQGIRKGATSIQKTKARFTAYAIVNEVLRRPDGRMQDWNDEAGSEDKVADLLEGLARRVDPNVRIAKVCWHGTPLCACRTQDACRRGHDPRYEQCSAASHEAKCPFAPPRTLHEAQRAQ